MIRYLVALFCVIGLAIGQILFKASAIAFSERQSFFSMQVSATFIAAICLYGMTSLAWVWVLQKVSLGRIYPLMALAFVLVPMASHFVFDEKFAPQYFLGVAFVVIGIVFAVNA